MGFWESIAELAEAASPWAVAEAEAPAEDQDKDKDKSEDKDEGDKEEDSKDDSKDEGEEGGEEGEDGGEEEEEEEEPEDPKEKLEEECKESKTCAPAKHHFDECVERVTGAEESSDKHHAHEDCVEEFFHLAHCATQCAAPKLWSILK